MSIEHEFLHTSDLNSPSDPGECRVFSVTIEAECEPGGFYDWSIQSIVCGETGKVFALTDFTAEEQLRITKRANAEAERVCWAGPDEPEWSPEDAEGFYD